MTRRIRAIALASFAAATLAACSPSMIDSLPTDLGGLPADAPKRSLQPPSYPAVHDVPARESRALTSDEQLALERQLDAARRKQQKLQDEGAIARAQNEAKKSNDARERAIEAAKKQRQEPVNR